MSQIFDGFVENLNTFCEDGINRLLMLVQSWKLMQSIAKTLRLHSDHHSAAKVSAWLHEGPLCDPMVQESTEMQAVVLDVLYKFKHNISDDETATCHAQTDVIHRF